MLQKIKKWGIYALVGISVCLLCGVAGYYVRWKTSEVITVGGGSIVERTNIHYIPFTVGSNSGCSDVIRSYNNLLADYKYFLGASPEVYSVTAENIYFKLATQRYKLSYNYTAQAKWSITPIVLARAYFNGNVLLAYGGGAMLDYGGIGGGVLVDSVPSLTLFAAWRCFSW